MKRLLYALLLFPVVATAGVFNQHLYKYADSRDVVMITYLDQVAHCAALTLSFKPNMFDDIDFLANEKQALHILEKSNYDQLPYYKSITDTYIALNKNKLSVGERDAIVDLANFLVLPKVEILHKVMVGTVDDVSEEIKDRVSGSVSDGTFKDYADAAYDIFNDESCLFSIGNYYEVRIMHSKERVDFPNFTEK